MEITITDINKLKLTPTEIAFLKTIVNKDDKYLKALNNVFDIFTLAKHLQKEMIIKIVNDKIISYKSFEVRKITIANYLKQIDGKLAASKAIFEHFIRKMEEYSNTKSRLKFNTYSKFLKERVGNGVDVNDANAIIDMKFKSWYNTEYQHHLNFQTLLGAKHYGQYVTQLEMKEPDKIEEISITKMI